jgi:hypothetical protein
MFAQQSSQFSPPACPDGLTERDRQRIEDRLHSVAFGGQPAITQRLAQLDEEWSAGRVAKIIIASGILFGLAAAVLLSWWWLALPVALGLLQLQYLGSREGLLTRALKKLGLRSSVEIEHERFALKALRGDFHNLPVIYERADEDALSRLEGEGGIVDDAPPSLSEDNRAVVKEVIERLEAHR